MDQFREVSDVLGASAKNLKRMGLLTGLAIAIHNFPEGLATFVATLSDPSFGMYFTVCFLFNSICPALIVLLINIHLIILSVQLWFYILNGNNMIYKNDVFSFVSRWGTSTSYCFA